MSEFNLIPEAVREEAAAWMRSRPASVKALMREWPPGAHVRAVESEALLVPRPGAIGVVNSYYEGGTLGIIHLNPEDDGIAIAALVQAKGEAGLTDDPFSGQCQTAWLELVDEPAITREEVAAVLDEEGGTA